MIPVINEKKDKIASLAKTCGMIARVNRRNPSVRLSDIHYYDLLEKYYTRVQHAHEEGKFLAAHTVFFPTEIIYAMDIVPMHNEMTTWLIALFLKEQAELLAAGNELGLASEICSPHRGLAGAFKIGSLPRPDAILWSNLICDNTAKSGEYLMEINKCPGFFLDHPFKESPAERKYFTHELRDLIKFLEEKSGHKMNWDKLSEAIARTNRELELFREINELRKAVPSPFHQLGFLELVSVDYLFPGQPEAIEYLTTVRDELAGMVKQNKGAVTPERYRLMTLFVSPIYLMPSLDKIFRQWGAVSVVEPLFTYWPQGTLEPDKPLESVAKKADMIPERYNMYGPLTERAMEDIKRCAEEYKVDGAVYWAFMGCRHTCATVKIIKDALSEVDVPMLTVDCDIVDPTINPEDETRAKLEQFFELLEDR